LGHVIHSSNTRLSEIGSRAESASRAHGAIIGYKIVTIVTCEASIFVVRWANTRLAAVVLARYAVHLSITGNTKSGWVFIISSVASGTSIKRTNTSRGHVVDHTESLGCATNTNTRGVSTEAVIASGASKFIHINTRAGGIISSAIGLGNAKSTKTSRINVISRITSSTGIFIKSNTNALCRHIRGRTVRGRSTSDTITIHLMIASITRSTVLLLTNTSAGRIGSSTVRGGSTHLTHSIDVNVVSRVADKANQDTAKAAGTIGLAVSLASTISGNTETSKIRVKTTHTDGTSIFVRCWSNTRL
jgi:hypothetical protein